MTTEFSEQKGENSVRIWPLSLHSLPHFIMMKNLYKLLDIILPKLPTSQEQWETGSTKWHMKLPGMNKNAYNGSMGAEDVGENEGKFQNVFCHLNTCQMEEDSGHTRSDEDQPCPSSDNLKIWDSMGKERAWK